MDIQKVLYEFDNDKEFLNNVVQDFFKTVDDQIKKMEKALEQGDLVTIKNCAHLIKGGAANLTAMRLSGAAFKLEKLGKSNSIKGMDEGLKEFKKDYTELCEFYGDHFIPRADEW